MTQADKSTDQAEQAALSIYYDGGCPVCRLEVEHYQKIAPPSASEWIDLETMDEKTLNASVSNQKSRDDLLGKFHVRDNKTGTWWIGVEAFERLWAEMPYWRRMTWLFRIQGFKILLGLGYKGFLKWQRWDRKRRLRKSH